MRAPRYIGCSSQEPDKPCKGFILPHQDGAKFNLFQGRRASVSITQGSSALATLGRWIEHLRCVRQSQVEVAKADPHGAWVDCDDLNDVTVNGAKTNALHYTKAGYELLGRRFVRQAKALILGQKPAENGRPE